MSPTTPVTPTIPDKRNPEGRLAETDLVYRFQISRRAHPAEFKNLWQLIAKTPSDDGPIELIDADSLETVINRLRYVFEADGL